MKKIVFILSFIFIGGNAEAQFSLRARVGTGLSHLINSEKELEKYPNNIFDITPTGNVYYISLSGDYTFKKTTLSLGLSYMRHDFMAYYIKQPPHIPPGPFLDGLQAYFPYYVEAKYKFRYNYIGLEINREIFKNWRVGIGMNYGIRNQVYGIYLGGYEKQEPNDLITKVHVNYPNPTDLLGKDRAFPVVTELGKYSYIIQNPILVKINARYKINDKCGIVGEYQHNFESYSTISDYRFHLFTIGLEMNMSSLFRKKNAKVITKNPNK